MLFFLQFGKITYAEELEKEDLLKTLDIDAVSKELKSIMGKNDISFSEIMSAFMSGDVDKAFGMTKEKIIEKIIWEFKDNRMLIGKMIVLIIFAAVFNSFSDIMKSSYVGENGFYVTYMMLTVLMMTSFQLIYGIALEAGEQICEIMQCIIPVFAMSMTISSGITTSQAVYQLFMVGITFTEKMIVGFLLPIINIYLVLVLVNNLSKEDRFSKMASLMKNGIFWTLKSILAFIVGLNMIKGLVVPVYDSVKKSLWQKGIAMIPGGSAVSAFSDILINSGVLIKNSIGAAAVLILITVVSMPVVKIFVFLVSYKVLLAAVQPISDARIVKGMQGVVDASKLVLSSIGTIVILFVISIAVMAAATN